MDRHIQLVGILNIAYRAMALVIAILLLGVSAWLGSLAGSPWWPHHIQPEVIQILPILLCVIAAVIFVVSIIGIIAGIGILKRKEWGRIMLLVVTFFNLLHIPIGTALGVYTLWVLLNSEVVKAFNPTAGGQLAPTHG